MNQPFNVYRRQILTSIDGPRAERVKVQLHSKLTQYISHRSSHFCHLVLQIFYLFIRHTQYMYIRIQ